MNERVKALSPEKLETYRIAPDDTPEELIERYYNNVKLSEAFYPALSLLEVCLRNHIYNAIVKNFNPDPSKNYNWLIEEYNKQNLLHDNEHALLLEAVSRLQRPVYENGIEKIIPLTEGKIIAELTFGFWVHLLSKKYHDRVFIRKARIFDDIFPYYESLISFSHPTKHRIKYLKQIHAKLSIILKLRNRISHHEPIFNFKQGVENVYNDIENILTCMSLDIADDLEKYCRFKTLVNNL